jgi:sec-independent protein translocase protein TatA
MFQIGPLEVLVVLIIALLVLGPQRLPDVARSVGKGMREFRQALDSAGHEDEEEVEHLPEHESEPDEDET